MISLVLPSISALAEIKIVIKVPLNLYFTLPFNPSLSPNTRFPMYFLICLSSLTSLLKNLLTFCQMDFYEMGFLVCLALQVGISGLVQVEYGVQFWPSHYQKDCNKLEGA